MSDGVPDDLDGVMIPAGPMTAVFRTQPPAGWLRFLEAYPDQRGAGKETIALTAELLAEAAAVNQRVNLLGYVGDTRADTWRLAQLDPLEAPEVGGFDCEDICLTKRALLARTIPMGALRPALCEVPEPHMVLLLVTDRGEFVMDNRTNFLLPWDRAFGIKWGPRWADADTWELVVQPQAPDIDDQPV